MRAHRGVSGVAGDGRGAGGSPDLGSVDIEHVFV